MKATARQARARKRGRGYVFAIAWIALNDEPELMAREEIAQLISVMLVADLFDEDPNLVADDIASTRERSRARESTDA